MLVFGRVFGAVTSLALVCLTIASGRGMTLSEDRRDESTRMAPSDDQSESTSPMSVTQSAAGRKYTESREVQDHIDRLFTYAGRPRPSRPPTRSKPTPPTLKVPKCATERSFCTEAEAEISDEVSEAVNQLLGSSPAFRQQFNATDVLTQEDQTIVQRGPDDPVDNHLCGFKLELSRVTYATSDDHVVMRIAQSKDFEQAVRLERCTSKNCRCNDMFSSSLLRPYRARCKQKYVYRTLLALTEEANKTLKLVPHDFSLPSCCSCVITKELNFPDDEDKCKVNNNNNNNNNGGGLWSRISPNDPPEKNDNTTKSNAAQCHNNKHSLLHVWIIVLIISFIYLHFK